VDHWYLVWFISIVYVPAHVFSNSFSHADAEFKMDVRITPVFMFGAILLFLLFIAALYPVSVLTQSSLTLGVLKANEEDSETLSAIDLIKKSLPFF
jgi:hypothetical protein